MAAESQDELDRRLKELECEKREEELRQLKASGRVQWITPTALAALLPLVAGFGLWVAGEVRQYNAGYQALLEKDRLESEKLALQRQKDSLNVEIGTLLQLKEHYADQARQLTSDVEAKQKIMDETYLRAVFLSSEAVYALDHVQGLPPGPDAGALAAIRDHVQELPPEAAAPLENLLNRYEVMTAIFDASKASMDAFRQAVDLIPASDWTRRLRPTPTGGVIPGRSVMVEITPDGNRYYDINEGRFLTEEEAGKAR